jgi:hypothetical protein
MRNSDAERQSAATPLVAPDVECMLGTFPRLDSLCEHRRVEPTTAPRDRCVVNVIRDAEVAKWAEVTALDALRERALLDQVVRAQCQQVSAVHAIGGRGKPEHEPWLEVLNHPPVTASGGVMKLIDDYVVEPVRLELVQVPGECLHACEQHAGV